MVGGQGRTGGGAAELTAGLQAGYEAAASAWADGPGPLYTQLARVLVATAPVPLAGAVVLDLGAGTGAAGWAALAAGARQVVAADLSPGMLRHARDRGAPAPRRGAAWEPIAADAVALPFRDHSFDLVLAAFCLNHLDSLAAGHAALTSSTDPRAAIIACYAAMERSLAGAGAAPAAADTPDEVLTRAASGGLIRSAAAGELTGLFRQARYGHRDMAETERVAAQGALTRLQADLGGAE